MESVSHAGTSNTVSETDNLFFLHAGTSNAASEIDNLFFPHAETSKASCGKSNNWGSGDGGATTESLRFEPFEIVDDSRVFRLGEWVILVRGFTASRTGPVSRAGVVGCGDGAVVSVSVNSNGEGEDDDAGERKRENREKERE
ncbi:hypothetical protein L3X38_031135 [Prunus dulcis]|uniref:Uncharacterized protein n=1 Tax=Prunus dulcis TaxID=3755 RepID=A0AAD4VCL5_PRUDU|nr:hypothetical protein L3X38_031135 [Prunus dulcis]